MGLKSGETGAKSVLKRKCAGAFRQIETLLDARDAVLPAPTPPDSEEGTGAPAPAPTERRDQTAVFVDGNVALMQVPEAVGELGAFCNLVYGGLREALRAGKLVVVVFDEPEHLTNAKKEEQARRDAARRARTVTSSCDLTAGVDPDFSRTELEAMDNVHILKNDRRARSRLYDEVMRVVFERLATVMAQWAANGHEPGCLLLDGVDVRGADRRADEPRAPSLVGTDQSVVDKFKRESPIGEGDIKLIALETRLRELVSDPDEHPEFAAYRLAVTSTVDTDSFMTCMLDVAKRRVNPYNGALHSLFCMREPPSKRQREWDSSAKATFLCCDVALLEALIQQHLWSKVRGPAPKAEQLLSSALALSSSAALCGCDFTLDGLKGARFDHMWESLPDFIATEPEALARFGAVLANEPEVARTACDGLYRLCVTASKHMEGKPRFKRQAQSVGDVSDTLLKRAVWTAAYWSQKEHTACPDWGFLPWFQK